MNRTSRPPKVGIIAGDLAMKKTAFSDKSGQGGDRGLVAKGVSRAQLKSLWERLTLLEIQVSALRK